MKTYQPNNLPIKFVELTRRYDASGCNTVMEVVYDAKKWVLTHQNGVPTKVNRMNEVHLGVIDIRTKKATRDYLISDITLNVSLNKTSHGVVLQSPHYISKQMVIGVTDHHFNEMLDGLADEIIQYYEKANIEQPEKETPDMNENEFDQEDVTKLPDALRKRIKINNIIYNLDGVPNQSPTPIYEIEVDLAYINVYPHIQSVLLNVYVCYDGASQKFHAKVETVQINGVTITDLQLDDSMFQELSSIYMHDALKRIDFTSAIENHLRMLNSRLDQCYKILNSNLES